MLAWFYLAMTLVGGFFLLLTLIAIEASEAVGRAGEGFLEAVDTTLEGLGIDLIPDSLFAGQLKAGQFSVQSILAFCCFFGATGLISTGYFGASPLTSVFVSIGVGLLASLGVRQLGKFLISQQASSESQDRDFIGASARVSVKIPKNGIGQITLVVRGQRVSLGARTKDGSLLPQGAIVTIERKEGSTAIVIPEEDHS